MTKNVGVDTWWLEYITINHLGIQTKSIASRYVGEQAMQYDKPQASSVSSHEFM